MMRFSSQFYSNKKGIWLLYMLHMVQKMSVRLKSTVTSLCYLLLSRVGRIVLTFKEIIKDAFGFPGQPS